MEQPNQFQHNNASSSFTSASPESTSNNNGEYSGDSPNSLQIAGEEEANQGNTDSREGHPQFLPQGTILSYRTYSVVTEDNQGLAMGFLGRLKEESWSCVVIVFTFWFFASVTIIVGIYGPASLLLGPNSSILITPNSFFVEYVKVEELYEAAADGLTLYGFHKDPPLDVVITWSDSHNATLQSTTQKEWIYFLNKGSQINISYTVNSTSSSSVVLVIAQGYEGLSQWLDDPFYPNTTLSWQVIQGNGTIQQNIFTSSSYYVAMRNLKDEAAVVQLNMRLRTLLYNTSGAYDKCSFAQGDCSVKLSLGGGNAVLLTSPGPTPGSAVNEWDVKLSYGPRWITYIAGIGGMIVLVLLAIRSLSYCLLQAERRNHFGETRSGRTPLLPHKDDDLSSWGSSCDSVSQDDEESEDPQALGLVDGKPTKDGENNTRRLCAICYDAPRDSFFLPCGHCVACFACGTRIAEAAGTCPVCRKHMKKVRKIFTV